MVVTPPSNPLRDKLQVVAPSEIVDFVNLLDYGEPGVGKTFLTGTAADDPRTSPVLIFDVEGGMTTLRNKPGIDVVPVRSIKELTQKYNEVYESIDRKLNRIYYKTVGIDSLTELADLDMRDIMKEAYGKNPDKVDVDVPSQREWGKSRAHIRSIVRAFRDLPCNVIFTASIASQQEEGQPTKVFPGFAGKLRTEVPGFMDIVGYYYNDVDAITGEVTRRLQFQGTRRVVAKDRTSRLGGYIDDPTIPKIWDLINSNSQGEN